MKRILDFYEKIKSLGEGNSYSNLQNKQTRLLNIYVLITFHLGTIFYILDLFFVAKPMLHHIIHHLNNGIMLFIFCCNKKHWFTYAKFIWIAYLFIAINLSALVTFPGLYTEYYFLLIPVVSLSIYSKKIIPIITLFLSTVYFFIPYWFFNIYPSNHPTKIRLPLIIGLFYTIYAVLNYFKKLNIENEEKLVLAYKELEDSKQKELAHLQLQSLKSQMNPHFIFNALNSIQEYIVLNQKRLASDYLGKFADLIRTYLNQSLQDFITLEEEVDCLNMYLELEKLRFEDKLSYTINYANDLELDTILIPTMLLQPFVENALKHGLLHKKEKGTLIVDFKKDEKEKLLHCSITDNGIGRDKANRIRLKRFPRHTSFASKATEDRLILINENLDKDSKKTTVTIVDLFANDIAKGTQVNITIPIKNNYENN